MKIKHPLFLAVFVLLMPISAVANQLTTLEIVATLVKLNVSDKSKIDGPAQNICLSGGRPSYDCPSYIGIEQAICLSGGRPSYDCQSYVPLGQAICLSGGRPNYDCQSYTPVGQGVCLSTGRANYDCPSYTDLASGLCLAKGHPSYTCSSISVSGALSLEVKDVSWAWDKFYDQYGKEQWQCRGRNTGQFAQESKCAGKVKSDSTWPTMRM